MSETVAKTFEDFILPPSIVSKLDLAHLVTEMERVDNEMTKITVVSEVSEREQDKPILSDQFEDFLEANELSLSDSHQRSEMIKQLRLLKNKVPVLHMTFAVPADNESLQQLADWVRTSVHPQAVITVGLQPALVAGVYLRTPNHVYDLSLRKLFANRRNTLVEAIGNKS